MDTYSHVLPGLQQEAAQRSEEALSIEEAQTAVAEGLK